MKKLGKLARILPCMLVSAAVGFELRILRPCHQASSMREQMTMRPSGIPSPAQRPTMRWDVDEDEV